MTLGANRMSQKTMSEQEMQTRVYTWLGFWRDKMPPEAVENLQDLLGPLRMHGPAIIREELAAEIRNLREEVEVLRRYGNKDCTAMADEALRAARLAK
jgi:hypothetical protein